ncbi:MAG: DUF3175 domain-containing protein [Bacteroidetes bacterium]|nr:DUF3175 domain-containing protein [Bacteroidota bacterium]MBS1686137.1 DUF3175 domain-containing protein [Bacteroidota bacterium]
MAKKAKTHSKGGPAPASKKPRRWSGYVTETSHALSLEDGVFKKDDPKEIARSLKRSAEHSKDRKGTPLQSAMSMLNFYINRGGKNLSAGRKKILEQAKDELHRLFHKDE